MGIMPADKIMYTLYASYIAVGLRGVISCTASLKDKMAILAKTMNITSNESESSN
jgi:hypothetical protein